MGKDKLIPLVAMVLLLVGSFSSLYVYTVEGDTSKVDVISINGRSYSMDQIFSLAKQRSLVTDDGVFSGVALDDLIEKVGVTCGSCHTYTIVGSDGYSKTVKWKNLKNGVLMEDRRVVFSDLPKAFRVRNVVSIEVK
ncbi:MAG TPA: hypothetical protein ENI42_01060 [Thermoplasmatales archaeon]|nr:hypothetical protein [Thermoplasmatales archaeon]